MKNKVETMVEPRKQWTAPELKKVDVEQITAFGSHPVNTDIFHSS